MSKIAPKPQTATQAVAERQLPESQVVFGRAIEAKRAGRLDEAIALLDEAHKLEPEGLGIQIARAGYQHLQGDAEGARARFDSVPVPGPVDGPVNPHAFDYFMNATWFHGLIGDDAGVLKSAAKTLEQVPLELGQKVLGEYIDSEPDLAHMRTNPKLMALLGRAPADPAAGFEGSWQATEGVAADFAASQSAAPTGQSPLDVRTSSRTKPRGKKAAALDALRALEPPTAKPLEQLGELIASRMMTAALEGDPFVRIDTNEVDRLLKGEGKLSALEARLEEAGFRASADGFTGVAFTWELEAGAKSDALDALRALKPPSGDAREGLVGLVERAIANSDVERDGKRSASLETGELDRVVRPLKISYAEVRDALKDAGFQAFADGFTGVSLGWDAGSDQVDVKQLGELALPDPAGLDAGARLTALVERAVGAAVDAGETRAQLDHQAFTGIAKELKVKPQELLDALEDAGFSTDFSAFANLIQVRWGLDGD